jgi:hypothetical protein
MCESERTESRRLRVLLVPVESVNWQRAQAWSYTLGLAFEEGLTAHRADCTVLPALEGFPSLSPRSWLYHAPRLLEGQTFDQAWVWLTDDIHDSVFVDWLAAVAPVRVGVITSSLEYTSEELREAPELHARRDTIHQQLRALTHALAVDEHDARSIRERLGMPAAWLPCSVPARTLAQTVEADASKDVPEDDAMWPARFDALQREMLASLTTGPVGGASLERYVGALRTVRRALFARTLTALRRQAVSINPPSALKAYAPLVVESMTAGVPVVSWDIPHRPANRARFTPDREIRLFDRTDRDTQERHLRELRARPDIAHAQAIAAREAIARRHTVESEVARILTWIATGATSDPAVDQTDDATSAIVSPSMPCLPEGYQRRDGGGSGGVVSADRRPAPRPGARGISGGYDLAARLSAALGCTRIVDMGGTEPAGAIALASGSRLDVTVLAPAETTQAYARRCPLVNWITFEPELATTEEPTVAVDDGSLIVSVGWLERQPSSDGGAARLARLVERARCGLVISIARDRTWGASHLGPPPTPAHCQEWTASELAALFEAAGLDVVHHCHVPAAADRRELTAVATVVASRTLAPDERTRLRRVAADTLAAYLAERESASTCALSGALVSDVPRVAPVVANPSVPSAHVLLDDALISVYGRVPAEEARRWAERLEPLDGAPLVLFGLGLGYHALAAAARPDSGRVLVVEPFDRMAHVARAVDATREALDRTRIEVLRDWSDFSRLVRRERLDLARARFADVPGYWRLAGDAYTTFVTLFEGARAWDRAGLGSSAKPFCHEPGMSVVISTFNRHDAVRRLIEDLARQRPCGVPIEVLLVNDDGETGGFPAICEAAHERGLDLRLFDTHFAGYGLTLARNIGLRFARYDTTVLLDDDLRIAPDLLWQYSQAPASIRAGRIDAEFDDSGVRRSRPDPRLEMRGREARVLRPWSAYETFLWGGNCAVTTELGLALGGFDESFLGEGEEDTDFGARAVRATHRPVAVPGAWARHEGLDQTTRVWLGFATASRAGRSRTLLADAGRGVVVNGGVEYWGGTRWAEFERVGSCTV